MLTPIDQANKPRGASEMDKREIDLDYTEISSTDKSILLNDCNERVDTSAEFDKSQIYKDLKGAFFRNYFSELQQLNQEILEQNRDLINKNEVLAK
jgi:hypothetical protein